MVHSHCRVLYYYIEISKIARHYSKGDLLDLCMT